MNEDSSESINTVLADADGHRVEVASVGKFYHDSEDTMMIHINVDDLEQAITFMTSMGFKEVTRASSASADYCTVVSPTGFKIDLCEHLKK